MAIEINKKIQSYWPLVALVLLVLSAFTTKDFDYQYLALAVIMFLMPMLDGKWIVPVIRFVKKDTSSWLVLIIIAVGLLVLKPDLSGFFISTLIFAAFPEEWFFRAYLMGKIGTGIKANVIASIGFSVLHAITINWVAALMVFIPSLAFGWIYQKQGNIVLLAFIHAVSNLVYTAYLYQFLLRNNLYW